jgi:hypothetical protein
LVRNEFEDRVEVEKDIENPIDYLKFTIGFQLSILALVGYAFLFRAMSILALKLLAKRFE